MHLKAVIWTALLVSFIYVTAMAIPVLINEYQFQDTLEEIARFATVNHKTPEQIQKAVLDQGAETGFTDRSRRYQGDRQRRERSHQCRLFRDDYSLKVYQWTHGEFHTRPQEATPL